MPGQQQKDSRPNPAAARHQPHCQAAFGWCGADARHGAEHGRRDGRVTRRSSGIPELLAISRGRSHFGGGSANRLHSRSARAHQCGYCLAAHTAIGTSVGLTDDEVHDARSATSPDRKTEAVLTFRAPHR